MPLKAKAPNDGAAPTNRGMPVGVEVGMMGKALIEAAGGWVEGVGGVVEGVEDTLLLGPLALALGLAAGLAPAPPDLSHQTLML